jgi:hypothetical protein
MEDVSRLLSHLPSLQSRGNSGEIRALDEGAGYDAWGEKADEIIELNFLVCANAKSGYYDLFLQKGSDVPSGKTCSNYQTIHLPCLC